MITENMAGEFRRWSMQSMVPETDFKTMVKDSYPELQALVHTPERRRSTRIPLDNKNSRVLRQSITTYLGQSTSIQDELVTLERHIEQLKEYTTAVPTALSVEDEQMHEIERYMKTIGCTACAVRSLLKNLEPRSESNFNIDYSPATLDRQTLNQRTLDKRGSHYSTRCSQYQTLAQTVHATMATYKEAIDGYYTKLVSNSPQNRPISYWVVAEDEDDPATRPLLDSTLDMAKVKQRLSVQEHEITQREKRIREWHKLLSTTFQSRYESDDESGSSSSMTSPPSYDIEAGLVKVHEYNTAGDKTNAHKKKPFSLLRCALAFLLTIFVVIALLAAVGVTMYYVSGIGDKNSNMTTADLAMQKTTISSHIVGMPITQPNYVTISNIETTLGTDKVPNSRAQTVTPKTRFSSQGQQTMPASSTTAMIQNIVQTVSVPPTENNTKIPPASTTTVTTTIKDQLNGSQQIPPPSKSLYANTSVEIVNAVNVSEPLINMQIPTIATATTSTTTITTTTQIVSVSTIKPAISEVLVPLNPQPKVNTTEDHQLNTTINTTEPSRVVHIVTDVSSTNTTGELSKNSTLSQVMMTNAADMQQLSLPEHLTTVSNLTLTNSNNITEGQNATTRVNPPTEIVAEQVSNRSDNVASVVLVVSNSTETFIPFKTNQSNITTELAENPGVGNATRAAENVTPELSDIVSEIAAPVTANITEGLIRPPT